MTKLQINIDEMFKELKKPKARRFNLGLGLWLLWRRAQQKPVTAAWVEKNTGEASVAMVENFFSKKYGIGGIAKDSLSLKTICDLFDQPHITKVEAEKMILEYEEKYGPLTKLAKNNRKRN